ncbi:MAG TPA: helix-turn-helix transcriptional regulator [Vicinamibacterales bacterium]|nr:helix-turn-helix transcriptional regulator [Vicinamibacterales bacterium]
MAPLTSAVVHVLLSLASQERHGYGIFKEVLRQTNARVRLGPGTLYGTLQRLMECGWVEEVVGLQATAKARRYYRLTRDGREALRTEMERLDALVRTARAERVLIRPTRG